MLNIDELIIFYIILNYQINNRVIRDISCHPIINWVMLEIVLFDLLSFMSCSGWRIQ